jgi:hypothetical protein
MKYLNHYTVVLAILALSVGLFIARPDGKDISIALTSGALTFLTRDSKKPDI